MPLSDSASLVMSLQAANAFAANVLKPTSSSSAASAALSSSSAAPQAVPKAAIQSATTATPQAAPKAAPLAAPKAAMPPMPSASQAKVTCPLPPPRHPPPSCVWLAVK